VSGAAGQAADPVEQRIEAALAPGRFVSDRACFRSSAILRPSSARSPARRRLAEVLRGVDLRFTGVRPDPLGVVLTRAGLLALALLRRGGRGR
jgi:hypothetical protein